MTLRHGVITAVGLSATYLTVLIGAAVLIVSLIAMGAAAGDGAASGATDMTDEVSGQLDINPLLLFLGSLFQLAGTVLLGSLSFTVESEFLGGAPLTILSFWGPNLLILLLAMLAGCLLMRLMFRRAGNRPALTLHLGARILLILASSLAATGITFLLTLATALRHTEQMVGTMVLGSASPGLFFGTWLAFALVVWGGTGLNPKERAAASRVLRFLPGLSAAWRTALTHVGLVGLPLLLLFILTLLTDGAEDTVLSVLVWGPLMFLLLVVMASFGTIHAGAGLSETLGGDVGQLEQSGHMYIFTSGMDTWFVVLAPILGVLALVGTAALWAAVRDRRPEVLSSAFSWATLPLIYLLLGSVLTLLARASFRFDLGGPQLGGGADASLGPSWWNFAWFLLLGVIIEAGSRALVPITGRTPRGVVRLLGGAAAGNTGAPAPGRPPYPPQHPQYQQPPHPPYPPQHQQHQHPPQPPYPPQPPQERPDGG